MQSQLFLPGWLCAAALAAGACVSLSDLPRAQEDGEEPSMQEPDAMEEDAPLDADMDEPDADAEAMAQTEGPDGSTEHPSPRTDAAIHDASNANGDAVVFVDAHVEGGVDPGPVIVEPRVDASVKSCTTSTDCATDEACDGAQCVPRCTSYGACVAFVATRPITSVSAVDDVIYWQVAPSRDALDNPRKDGELWRKAHGSAPIRVLDALGEADPLVVKGGYVYYQQGVRLYRSPLQADAPVEPLYMLEGDWVVGDSFLAFTSPRGIELGSLDGSAALRTITFTTNPAFGWETVIATADRVYFKRSGPWGLSVARVVEPFTVEDTPATYFHGSNPFIRGSMLYRDCDGHTGLCAEDLVSGDFLRIANAPAGDGGFHGSTTGDWTYWGNPSAGLQRFSLISLGRSQTIVPQRAEVFPFTFAASAARFYFAAAIGVRPLARASRLLYEMPLPPEPCASDLPCPNGKSCGADMLCH